jgi:hypothetical protein
MGEGREFNAVCNKSLVTKPKQLLNCSMNAPLAVEWYYADKDGRKGPLGEEILRQKVISGELSSDILVWREGMAGWSPAKALFLSQESAPVHMGVCAECGKELPMSQLLPVQGVSVCESCKPNAVQKVMEGVMLGTSGGVEAWRDGKLVLTHNGCILPNRCVRCNAPSEKKMKRKLQWHPPLIYLTLLISPLIYIIVGLCVRKRATVHAGVCLKHRVRLIVDQGLSLFLSLAGLIICFFGFAKNTVGVGVSGLMLFVLALVYAAGRVNLLTPHKIDKDGQVWLKGAGKPFLDSLPPVN